MRARVGDTKRKSRTPYTSPSEHFNSIVLSFIQSILPLILFLFSHLCVQIGSFVNERFTNHATCCAVFLVSSCFWFCFLLLLLFFCIAALFSPSKCPNSSGRDEECFCLWLKPFSCECAQVIESNETNNSELLHIKHKLVQ